ncbi:MAG: hypothetical protein AB1486_33890 [Planctomycetota bacterium]
MNDRLQELLGDQWRAHGAYVRSLARSPVAADEPNRELDLWVSRGCTVTGHVEDAETGEALAGARVLLCQGHPLSWSGSGYQSFEHPYSPRVLLETCANEQGQFAFENVPSRGFHYGYESRPLGSVAAWKDGFVPGFAKVRWVEDGETQETATIRCWPTAVVRGRVLDPENRPLEDIDVIASAEGRPLGEP